MLRSQVMNQIQYTTIHLLMFVHSITIRLPCQVLVADTYAAGDTGKASHGRPYRQSITWKAVWRTYISCFQVTFQCFPVVECFPVVDKKYLATPELEPKSTAGR